MTTRAKPNEVTTIRAWIEGKPPSVNRLYTTSFGRRVLRKEGEAFKSQVMRAVQQATLEIPTWPEVTVLAYKVPYYISLSITVVIAADDFWNKSWRPGEVVKQKKGAKGPPTMSLPYKRQDGSNFIKIVEDGVALGTGIDDAMHRSVRIRTKPCSGGMTPGVLVVYKLEKKEEHEGRPYRSANGRRVPRR